MDHTPLSQVWAGAWSIERHIRDALRNESGVFRGTTEFFGAENELTYREHGTLELPHYTGTAHRVYIFRFTAPAKASVFFEDGRFFHDLDLNTGTDRVVHRCGNDIYEGVYEMLNAKHLNIRWHVTGPQKDVYLDTRMTKQPS